jgi:micrococcal nuclease
MRIPRKRYLIPIFAAVLILFRLAAEIGPERKSSERFRVIDVIDGDTVILEGGDRLRLTGIDCPEKGGPFYDSSVVFLRRAVLGRMVTLEFGKRRRDGYGRLLADIYVDSVWVNRAIVAGGLGWIYLFEDNLENGDKLAMLLAAQRQALDRGAGVWSVERSPEPFYLARIGSFRFHRPYCGAVRGVDVSRLVRFESRVEALKEGYSPCRNCRP